MYRTAIRKFAHLARNFGVAVLFFTVLALQIPSFGAIRSPDLVFCPLQKEWIKKSEPSVNPARAYLADICAPPELKARFSDRLGVRTVAASIVAADLFLDFTAKGEQALIGIPFSPPSNSLPAATISRNAGRAVASQFNTDTTATNAVTKRVGIAPSRERPVYNSYYSRAPYPEAISNGVTQRGPPELL